MFKGVLLLYSKKSYLFWKNPHIIVKRIFILLFVCLGLFGFAINLQNQDIKNKINRQLNILHISKENQDMYNLEQKAKYIKFRNQNSKKIITYNELTKKISHGELLDTCFAIFPYNYKYNCDYIVDMYQDRTQDYINDTRLYDRNLDSSNEKLFTNKKILYNHNNIIKITSLEEKNANQWTK